MAYIDKERVLNILRARQCLHQEDGDGGCADSLWDMCLAIEYLPEADVVEVVRCKDCEYWENGKYYKPYCDLSPMMINTKANDFCSYGKRKENTNEQKRNT